MSGRFAIIPAWALDDNLSPTTLMVLLTLSTYADDNGWCFPKVKTLAGRMECSDRTIQRSLTDLEKRGYLERHEQELEDGRQTSNLYRIVYDRPKAQAAETAENKTDPRGGDTDVTPTEICQGGGDTLHVTPRRIQSNNTHTSALASEDDPGGEGEQALTAHPTVQAYLTGLPSDLHLERELDEWQLNNRAQDLSWHEPAAAFCRWLGMRAKKGDYAKRPRDPKPTETVEALEPWCSKLTQPDERELIQEWARLVVAAVGAKAWNDHGAVAMHELRPREGGKLLVMSWRDGRERTRATDALKAAPMACARAVGLAGVSFEYFNELPEAHRVRSILGPLESKGTANERGNDRDGCSEHGTNDTSTGSGTDSGTGSGTGSGDGSPRTGDGGGGRVADPSKGGKQGDDDTYRKSA